MNVVVTGGSGALGREVVDRLRQRQVRTVPASRRTGFDLATGEGVREVLADADVVVHAATNGRFRKVDLDGTRRIIRILQERSSPPHLIYVSIVGVDRSPFPYYRAKYACELVLERSGLPVTVVRVTQFHTLVRGIGRFSARGPVAVVPRDMAFQSCDPLWVADELAALTLADAPLGYRRASDLAGPERTTFVEVVELAPAGHPAGGRRRVEVVRGRVQPARSGRQDRRGRLSGVVARARRMTSVIAAP